MLKLVRRTVIAGVLALLGAGGAQAEKLFGDSELIVRDRFSVEVVGKGPDVVLIPGLSASRATWRETAERLKGTHRLHLVQVAGFAGEPARANAEGEVFAPTAEAIGDYIGERKLTPAVVGHSLGGGIALWLAQNRPEAVARAMIVDAYPFTAVAFMRREVSLEQARPFADMIRTGALDGDQAAYARMLEGQMAGMASDPDRRRQVLEWGLASDRSVVARAMYEFMLLDQRPGLAEMKTPITVAFADNAPFGAPAGMMEAIIRSQYARAAGARFAPVANALHFVMFDQPQAFAKALDDFLGS